MSRTGRPAFVRPAICAAIAACTDPLGMSCSEIAASIGRDPHTVSQTLFRLRKDKAVFPLGEGRDIRYFATTELRDAATAAYQAFMSDVIAQRIERAEKTKRECTKRYKAKLKKVGPKQPRKGPAPRKDTAQAKILAAVQACSDPLGMTMDDVRALAFTSPKAMFKALERLAEKGQVHTHGYRNWRRYFAWAEARDKAGPTLAKMQDDAADERIRLQRETRPKVEKQPKPPKAPKPPKPIKVKPPKKPKQEFKRPERKVMPATVTLRSVSRADFKNAEAIIPASLKITKCPPCQLRTFRPPEWFKGEFQREWQQLRASKEAA